MAAKTGSVLVAGKTGELGQQYDAVGYIDLDAALATTNTYTIANLFPKGKYKVVGFDFWSPELDTNASPTLTFSVGNSDDPDGYLKTINGGLPAQAPANGSQLNYKGNGDLIGTTPTPNRDVTLTVVADPATGVTSGRLFFGFTLEGV